jgi:RNA polymerase sigma-70 factor (ECF subfamily)
VTNRSELDPLVEAAREGDTEAFDELVRRTYGDVFKLAVRLTGNETDANDVVQDTYVRAFRGLRRFRGDAQFSTWLYRIASNCASSFTARRTRQRCDSLSEAAEVIQTNPDQDPTLQAEASTLRQTIERALEQLPQRLRAVVVLKHLEDLSHREIAERLGISESATKVRLHRARNTLRRILPLSDEHERADSDEATVAQIFSLDEHRASTGAPIDQRAAGE